MATGGDMDISDIAMLEAIVKHGSLSKASEVLYVSQPTLSKRLARLETVLATPLFHRSSSGLTPTAHTQFIIDNTQPLKTQIKNIQRHIELMNNLQEGELRLGVGPIVEQLYFPYTLLELTKDPSNKLDVSIRTGTDETLKTLLQEGEIDIAIGPFEEDSGSDEFVVSNIANQPLIIAVRYDHPFGIASREGRSISAEEMSSYPLIAPHIPKYMNERFQQLFNSPPQRVMCDNYSVIKEVLKQSDDFSIGPGAVFSREVINKELTFITPPVSVQWHAACMTLAQNAELPFVHKVIDAFRQYPLPEVNS
jgi:DNA-binding transcriptional LysR family regulator